MISRTAEYAIHAALWLAAHNERPHAAREIAAETSVPAGYLAKILQELARAGLVRAQPGPGGGFLLRNEPRDVRLLELINAVDPIRRIVQCPLGIESHSDRLCSFHARLDRTLALIEAAFADCTLADLLADDAFGRPASDDCRARNGRCRRTGITTNNAGDRAATTPDDSFDAANYRSGSAVPVALRVGSAGSTVRGTSSKKGHLP